ncbi:hypothetical protein [Natrarchaeobius chitinivorans]|uniref:hypothetical protein n=1 Tax=Natrarchaeobius chitinivorans TaxID=1679083 RepID=UPI000F53A0B4|nr:hypothetical protein [Natrarchaeobius chitinivorans]
MRPILPTAHRLGTVLLVVLMVGSLVAPAAMTPTAADDGSLTDDTVQEVCDSSARFVYGYACGVADLDDIDDSQSTDKIEADIWLNARQTGESWESTEVLLGNYMEDTPTIASLEARDAIATSWEEGDDVDEADIAAKEAINDYYSQLQIQVIEEASAHQHELAYQQNQSRETDDVNGDMVHPAGSLGYYDGTLKEFYYTHESGNATYDLRNGTVHEYEMPVMYGYIDERDNSYSDDITWTPELGGNYDSPSFEIVHTSNSVEWNGKTVTLNQPEYNLESRVMYDLSDPDDKLDELHDQAQVAVENYDEQFVDDLYTALDEGEIDPEDVRGAEGTVRYMSGDSDVTEERFQIALSSVLGLEHTEFDSTMVVSYDGYTDIEYEWNESAETREANYSSHVSETYNGLLFAGDVPEGGFEVNESYHTDDLDGTLMMVTENESVYFEHGEFTIDALYDSAGDPVQNVTWDRPSYDTYNSSEYVELIDEIQELHDELEDRDDGGDGVTLPGVGDIEDALGEYSGVMVGLVIVVGVVFLVVGFVTDILPWT